MTEKHVPLRMCVVTRKMLPKSELIRLVVTTQGIEVDSSQKKDGRGYWISKDLSIIQEARKKHSLDKILRRKVDEALYDDLEAYVGGKV